MPCVWQEKRYVKRHLFSDTDTDYAMTEVSWIRESRRKPKPKVTKYSRQACVKPKTFAPDSTCKLWHSETGFLHKNLSKHVSKGMYSLYLQMNPQIYPLPPQNL